ncbi:MAG TPA: septal ring lytic transglycosylase RlpA family protein [Acidimicrobiales bacterium]|nr:septal ring lytic transglycosylase RlpA family protein [Acidimicrobiales bacterium]
MRRAALSRRARPALAALAACAVALTAMCAGFAGAPVAAADPQAGTTSTAVPGGTGDPHVRRASLVVKIAELTDRMEATEAGVVDAQLRQTAASSALSEARRRLRDRAVDAYVRGRTAPVTAMDGPAVYLEIAARKQEDVMRRFRTARDAAAADQRKAEWAQGQLRPLEAQLQQARATLDAAVAADDARRQREADAHAAELRASDDARQRAMTASSAEWAQQAGGAPGYRPNPLDPQDLATRHMVATRHQIELMRRYPFGPLAPGAALPAGLKLTGQTVDGVASWYGSDFDGRPTATGAIYDMEGWTVASPDLPLGTFLLISRGPLRVLALVNDRGPYVAGRVLDLSHADEVALGGFGLGEVNAQVLAPA